MLWSSFFLSDWLRRYANVESPSFWPYAGIAAVCIRCACVRLWHATSPTTLLHATLPRSSGGLLRFLSGVDEYTPSSGQAHARGLEGPSCCAAPFVYVLTQRFYLLTQPCYEPAIYTPQCFAVLVILLQSVAPTLCWCTVSFHTAWLLLVGPLVRIRRGDGMAYVWIRQNLYSANYRVSQKASSNHPCVATSFHWFPVAALIHGCTPDHPQQCVVRFRATTNHLKCTHSTDPSCASLLAEVAPGTESVI